MTEFRLFVPGKAAPQGSRKFMGRSNTGKGIMVESSQRVRPWRDLIVTMALDAVDQGAPVYVGPVDVALDFTFDRPQHHFGSGKNAGLLKVTAPVFPRTGGDLDKLCRAACDALGRKHGAGVIADDADIVRLEATKHFATKLYPVGCVITVRAAMPL